MSTILYFDGGKRENKITYGIVIEQSEKIIFSCGGDLGNLKVSSNIAEYLALIIGLIKCIEFGLTEVLIKGDSLLLVNQMNGYYRIKSKSIKIYSGLAKQLIKNNNITIKLEWHPRELNVLADRLSRI